MSKPRYAQIADDLREKIDTGVYKVGDKLPTKSVLMEEWGAALVTVSKAMSVLQDQGLVATYHGVGSFVQSPVPAADEPTPEAETAELRSRVERLEAQMMDVFSNLGLAYPDAPPGTGDVREAM